MESPGEAANPPDDVCRVLASEWKKMLPFKLFGPFCARLESPDQRHSILSRPQRMPGRRGLKTRDRWQKPPFSPIPVTRL